LAFYVEENRPGVVGLIYPDRRGSGYALSRYNDHPAFDFTKINDHSEVHFAHARGFLAKTKATDTQCIRTLLEASISD